MPVNVHVESAEDGSKTIWFSDHDPLNRMKGMHGICLRPGKSVLELKVRAYNRTSMVQTFLWWANVATRVHEGYQSFFPPDVYCVADHAKRATSLYPFCEDSYYGVNYGERAKKGVPENEKPSQFIPEGYKPNDLTWYANIPVPTSYMCVGSEEDFFGGYDHHQKAGVVHVANHHISPGKKQWTWGNHEFGYAWDRNLTDTDGPYIEIMAGVYTDNQPDFSYLAPGETKTWSQFWYPIRDIGAAQMANTKAAISFDDKKIGVAATEIFGGAEIILMNESRIVKSWKHDLSPSTPFTTIHSGGTGVVVKTRDGKEIISYTPKKLPKRELPQPAQEPIAPAEMKSIDELFLTGLHLDQYRHATRKPEPYWLEALKRDPGDYRCNNGLGLRAMKRGEFEKAQKYFEKAIERLTKLNPNPYDGEPYYNLGQAFRFLGKDDEAYKAYYKATWNEAWQAAGYHNIAELDCKKGDWDSALDHLNRSLRMNTDNLRARDLKALVLKKLGRGGEANKLLAETLALDPLDNWAKYISDIKPSCDTQTFLDLALDFSRAGFYEEAITLLRKAHVDPQSGTAPLMHYYLAWLLHLTGEERISETELALAAVAPSDYCFPARLEEIAILNYAITKNKKDAKSPYYLGNLYYDKDRFEEGVRAWEESIKRDSNFAVVWRNLGIGYFNILNRPSKALAAFDKAFKLSPNEPRILYERDQLWKRMGKAPKTRLAELEMHKDLVRQWDGLTVELCALYNQTGQPEKALELVSTRWFQPWEGGEGAAMGQHVRTQLALGRIALRNGDAEGAIVHFTHALSSPENLGEAKHLLANQSDIHYWLGNAYEALNQKEVAKTHWDLAGNKTGDFQNMSVMSYSEMSYFTGAALMKLGKKAPAMKLFKEMLNHGKKLEKTKAKIDYFATSLPDMLLFNDDLQYRQVTSGRFIQALAYLGLGKKSGALKLLKDVLKRDPAHALAADFISELTIGRSK
jgi:tetratricopeptide (TPR) repeat protein